MIKATSFLMQFTSVAIALIPVNKAMVRMLFFIGVMVMILYMTMKGSGLQISVILRTPDIRTNVHAVPVQSISTPGPVIMRIIIPMIRRNP